MERKIRIEYAGSKGWLIFWAIVFFPVAVMLLATSGKFQLDNRQYYIRYDGSRGWLCFWTIFCFPITLVLLVLNGISLIATDQPAITQT